MPKRRKGLKVGKKTTMGRMKGKGQGEGVYHEIGKNKDLPEEGWTE